MKKFIVQSILVWFVYHVTVYLHEWTHGTIAWLTGYKSNPFNIHYGTDWFMLSDIDEAVPYYSQILADGKPFIMAIIAIAPTVLQIVLFLIGLRLLQTIANKWAFAFVYWFTFLELSEVYAYIPIRTFSQSEDIYNFLYATGLSPFYVFIPGTLFVLWGIIRMLSVEEPKACRKFEITSKTGRFTFLLANILIFFGYYGGVGFEKADPMGHHFSMASWILVPVSLFIFWQIEKFKTSY